VCDYTEKNPLHGYSFAFSTGDIIDTLEARGAVFWAENLNPAEGIYAGVHSNKDDSAFMTKPFDRVARTDTAGHFRIGNMRAGEYRLYALDDVSRDYRFTVSEALAYADMPVRPSLGDSLAPSSLLFLFRQEQQRLYLQRTTREQQHRVQLSFSSAPDSLPSFRALPPSVVDSTRSDSGWVDPMPYVLPVFSAHADTVTLWLTDSIAILQDTIYFETRYRRTDSLYRLEWYTDTLYVVWRAPRLTAKAKEAQERQRRNRRLEIKTNARKGFDLYDSVRIVCTTPLSSIERDSVHLYERVDTILKPIPFVLDFSPDKPLAFTVAAKWKEGTKYELHLDSAALHDVYGITHIKGTYPFETKTSADYSTLRVFLKPFVPKARIQLLNAKDQVVRELPAVAEGAFFQYLKPETYYLRFFIDENGDGKWTTGSWEPKRQPEPVYYYPEKVQTKSNWDFEEEWDYQAVPQTEAKPKGLIKASSSKKK